MSHDHDHAEDHHDDHTPLELALAKKVNEQDQIIDALSGRLDMLVTLEHILRLSVSALLPNVGDKVTIAVGKDSTVLNDSTDKPIEHITFFRDENMRLDMRAGD